MPLHTTVLITDDHKIFRIGMAATLKSIDGIINVLEADNGLQALEIVKKERVDIVFMDIRMPGIDGIETTCLIKELKPELKVIALSMFSDHSYVCEMFSKGASGYLLKNTDADEIEEAINTVLQGELYFSRDVSQSMLSHLLAKSNTPRLVDGTYKLTMRELEILPLICEGLATKEIAAELHLSARTVEGHRARLLEKTCTKNVAELAVYAVRNEFWKRR